MGYASVQHRTRTGQLFAANGAKACPIFNVVRRVKRQGGIFGFAQFAVGTSDENGGVAMLRRKA